MDIVFLLYESVPDKIKLHTCKIGLVQILLQVFLNQIAGMNSKIEYFGNKCVIKHLYDKMLR